MLNKLEKLYKNYMKYRLNKQGKQAWGHHKFSDKITKEQKQQLIEKDRVEEFKFTYNNDNYICSLDLYENAGYLHYKIIALKNHEIVKTKTFMSLVRKILIENNIINEDYDTYCQK